MKIALGLLVAFLYSWGCVELFGYTSTLYVPIDIQASPILYQAALSIYGMCAILILALFLAVIIIKSRLEQPIKLALLLGTPVIPITIYGVVNFLASAPALADLILSPRFLIGTGVNVIISLAALPVLVTLLRGKSH